MKWSLHLYTATWQREGRSAGPAPPQKFHANVLLLAIGASRVQHVWPVSRVNPESQQMLLVPLSVSATKHTQPSAAAASYAHAGSCYDPTSGCERSRSRYMRMMKNSSEATRDGACNVRILTRTGELAWPKSTSPSASLDC